MNHRPASHRRADRFVGEQIGWRGFEPIIRPGQPQRPHHGYPGRILLVVLLIITSISVLIMMNTQDKLYHMNQQLDRVERHISP